jgi:hypothetical protein
MSKFLLVHWLFYEFSRFPWTAWVVDGWLELRDFAKDGRLVKSTASGAVESAVAFIRNLSGRPSQRRSSGCCSRRC